jgi:hypothetical protein
MAQMVIEIRNSAKNLLGTQWDIDKYHLSYFMILYSSHKYDSYVQYVSTRYLGMLANKLMNHSEWFKQILRDNETK